MKRWFVPIIALCLLLTVTTSAYSQNLISIYVNGKQVSGDVPPQLVNGRVLVPIRLVSESLNTDVTWDSSTSSVYILEKSELQFIEWLKKEATSLPKINTLIKSMSSDSLNYSNITNLKEQASIYTDLIESSTNIHPSSRDAFKFNILTRINALSLVSTNLAIRALEEARKGNLSEAKVLMEEAKKIQTEVSSLYKSYSASLKENAVGE